MSLVSDISAIASVQVGEGGGASAVYPVTSLKRTEKREGAEGISPQRLRRITVTARCFAAAANLAAIAALRETLATTLCQTGARVRFIETGGTWDLPADTGATGGSAAGYPRVSIDDDEEMHAGIIHGFTVTAETLVPVPASTLVDHDFSVEEDTDYASGDVTENGRGTVRVGPGTNAKTWILNNVIDALETRVDGSDERLTHRISIGQDTTTATYTYTIAPADSVLAGGGITSARVVDELRQTAGGEWVRRISGDATGGSAATFAAAQEPTPGTGEALTSRSVSEPQVSDGRVAFAYEMLVGVLDAGHFGAGKYITRWSEEIGNPVAGIRVVGFHRFQGSGPKGVLGPQEGFIYTQEASVEWIGAHDVDVIPLAFDIASATATPARSTALVSPGRFRETLSASFFFETAQTIPAPHQLPALP